MTESDATTLTDTSPVVPAVDWQGEPLDCRRCPNLSLKRSGGCVPTYACVFDRYARRIERFFRWNRAASNDYLDHPYFEVRAIAARYADLFRLTKLIDDPDETVRMSLVARLPHRLLLKLRDDSHREVRVRVAQRLDAAQLAPMMADPDYYVRVLVARRLPSALLSRLRDDPDPGVRIEVAQRLDMPALLADDRRS